MTAHQQSRSVVTDARLIVIERRARWCKRMPRGRGKLQRRLLEQLHQSDRPLATVALSQGCGASEVRRAMGKLVLEGLVRRVGPNLWVAQRSAGSAGTQPPRDQRDVGGRRHRCHDQLRVS
jgi:hypothetical protein